MPPTLAPSPARGARSRPMPRPSLWTPEALGKLGYAPDSEIAELIGVTRAAVAQKRKHLGIPSWDERRGPEPRGPSSGRDLKIRLTDPERELVDRAAAESGVPVSTWARDAILRAAERGKP
jgi:hypothetical protein